MKRQKHSRSKHRDWAIQWIAQSRCLLPLRFLAQWIAQSRCLLPLRFLAQWIAQSRFLLPLRFLAQWIAQSRFLVPLRFGAVNSAVTMLTSVAPFALYLCFFCASLGDCGCATPDPGMKRPRFHDNGHCLLALKTIVIYKTIFVINIILHMYLQHSNTLLI